MTDSNKTNLERSYNNYFDQNFDFETIPVYDDKVQSLLKYVGNNQLILDVGCLTGYVGYFCLQKKTGNKVVGIDFIAGALEQARRKGVDARYCNVETDKLPIKKSESFDIIIMSEIIEHLVDPLAILKKVEKFLKKDGKIIISTPNIAYFQYRIELLLGKLPDFCEFRAKHPERPYNFQHKTFFTYKVLVETLRLANLKIEQLDSHGSYKNDVERYFDPLEKVFPGMFVKNLIAIATRNKERYCANL